MFLKLFDNIKNIKPLVHNITNYVTANDVANAELAIGASAVMADSPLEVKDITSLSDALNLNIGTLSLKKLKAMIISAELANKLDIPVVLDLVGVGASGFRYKAVRTLLKRVHFSVIKGNSSEIESLVLKNQSEKGVDAKDEGHIIYDKRFLDSLRVFCKTNNTVVVITGREDLIIDEKNHYIIKNGSSLLTNITGAGCMLSGIIAASVGANRDNVKAAAVLAVLMLDVSSELAQNRMTKDSGSASFKTYLIDELNNLTYDKIDKIASVKNIM